MMRVQTRRMRLWPKATELWYWPISFAPYESKSLLKEMWREGERVIF